jgi:hypothetical protein
MALRRFPDDPEQFRKAASPGEKSDQPSRCVNNCSDPHRVEEGIEDLLLMIPDEQDAPNASRRGCSAAMLLKSRETRPQINRQ